MNQKILWLVSSRFKVGAQLAITGRLDGVVQYRARFNKAYVAGSAGHYFPSIVAPPSAGCWTMTLTTRRLKAKLVVYVREHGE